MPIKEGRTYRSMPMMEFTEAKDERLLDSEYYVEGYATTFNQPYLLYRDSEGHDWYEQVDEGAFAGADMSDVIFLHNHEGKCLARNKMRKDKAPTLIMESRPEGLFVAADLGMIEEGREEWRAITGGLIYQMSFAFTVAEDEVQPYKGDALLRRITKVKKVYDVSSVDMPANPYTSIDSEARSAFEGFIEKRKQELFEAEQKLIAKQKALARIRILAES